MVKVGLIGAGKMGISHLSILGAHPDVQVVGVCDTSKLVLSALEKYSKFKCYTDYLKMIEKENQTRYLWRLLLNFILTL